MFPAAVCRAVLFKLINSHPTLFEVVTGQVQPNNGKPAQVQQATAGSKRKEGVMVREGGQAAMVVPPALSVHIKACWYCSLQPHCSVRTTCHRPCTADSSDIDALLCKAHRFTQLFGALTDCHFVWCGCGICLFPAPNMQLLAQPEAYQGTATASGSKDPSAGTRRLTHNDVSPMLVGAMAEVSLFYSVHSLCVQR